MRLFLLLATVQLAIVSTASANLPVFEAYVGQRPKKIEPAVTAFLAEMERISPGFFASQKRLERAFGMRLPLPGTDPSLTAVEFTRKLELADATWIRQPALAELLPVLATAVELGKANPAYLVSDAGRRDVFGRVLLAYALALKRSGGAQPSRDAMAEWIRTFPDQVITRARAGSDAEQLYQETRQAMSTRGRGTLTVFLTGSNLQLYVNEVIHRVGVPINDLLPGVYRVLVVDRFNRTRRYALDVLANQDSVLKVDWQVDSLLRVAPTFIVFELPSLAELAQAGQPIARFAQTAIGAPGVVLVKPSKAGHTELLTAEIYAPSRIEPIRSASVTLAGNARTNSERAISLAQYLIGDTSQPDVIINALPNGDTGIAAANPAPSKPIPPKTGQPPKPAPAPQITSSPKPGQPPEAALPWIAATDREHDKPRQPPLTPVTKAAAGDAPHEAASARPDLLVPGLMFGGGLIIGAASLYVASATSSDGVKRTSYVVDIGCLAAFAFGLAGIIDHIASDSPVASVPRPRALIGFAPFEGGGGAVTLGGRF